MLNKLEQNQDGSNNQQAARDVNNYQLILPILPTSKYDSMIGTLLQNIYNSAPTPKFSPPTPNTYTIKDKIQHNKIERYQRHYEIYSEKKLIIRDKIELIKQQHTDVEQKIYDYVQSQYLQVSSAAKTSDEVISELTERIGNNLLAHNNSALSAEQLSYTTHVIFFVFSECKIFEAPN